LSSFQLEMLIINKLLNCITVPQKKNHTFINCHEIGVVIGSLDGYAVGMGLMLKIMGL